MTDMKSKTQPSFFLSWQSWPQDGSLTDLKRVRQREHRNVSAQREKKPPSSLTTATTATATVTATATTTKNI